MPLNAATATLPDPAGIDSLGHRLLISWVAKVHDHIHLNKDHKEVQAQWQPASAEVGGSGDVAGRATPARVVHGHRCFDQARRFGNSPLARREPFAVSFFPGWPKAASPLGVSITSASKMITY